MQLLSVYKECIFSRIAIDILESKRHKSTFHMTRV